jgi:hypothetical protein
MPIEMQAVFYTGANDAINVGTNFTVPDPDVAKAIVSNALSVLCPATP